MTYYHKVFYNEVMSIFKEKMKKETDKKVKKYFFIKMNYGENNLDSPDVGMFDEFNEIEEEMIELVINKPKDVKIYFCDNVKDISGDNKKNVMAGAFETPKEFFNKNFKKEYKEFCTKYSLLIEK